MKKESSLINKKNPDNIWKKICDQWERTKTLPSIPEQQLRECYDAAPKGSELEAALGTLLQI